MDRRGDRGDGKAGSPTTGTEVVKQRSLHIEGFRGAPRPVDLKLGDRNYFVYSENGRGKSTLYDAAEFLTTGQLADFRREGCGLGAAVHVDSSQATVSAKLSEPNVEISRTLTGDLASDLDFVHGEPVEVTEIPMLKHSTIERFMDQRAGEKREALLELLDLDSLNQFRAALRKAEGDTREARRAAEGIYIDEKAALHSLAGGEQTVSKASKLAQAAGLDPITSDDELAAVEIRLPPGEPNRQTPVAELERAVAATVEDATELWNEAVGDQGMRRSEALSALLEQGKTVLSDWPSDSCPLCETEQDRAGLEANVAQRAAALAESHRRIVNLRGKVAALAAHSEQIASAFASLLALPPQGGWPEHQAMESARAALIEYGVALRRAGAEFESCPAAPDLGLDLKTLMPALRTAAEPKESPQLAAAQALSELRTQHGRTEQRRLQLEAAWNREHALEKVREIADETIKRAIEAELKGLGDLVARYFGVLMANPIYSDVELVFEARRSGQVEFSVAFDTRHTVKPPQRIMSESQLNALGLSLLLARVKTSETPWRTLVLDDVVNSFDMPHRQGLVRLLTEEFSDWQIVILSHDSVFRDVVRQSTDGGWVFLEITNWTPQGGPVIDDGDPLNRLAQALEAGEDAAGLGGFARTALEQRLSRPLHRLEYPIAYDPFQRYTANDYLRALLSGLKQAESPLAELPVLGRMNRANYMSTRLVHWRSNDPAPTTDDLRGLVADLRELDEGMRCTDCGKRPWFNDNADGHQCQCGKLTA